MLYVRFFLLIRSCQFFVDEILKATHFAKPGIRFTERMRGQMTLEKTGELTDLDFVVTIESQDVEFMIEKDPKHEASVVGNVTCPGLSASPLVIESGMFL